MLGSGGGTGGTERKADEKKEGESHGLWVVVDVGGQGAWKLKSCASMGACYVKCYWVQLQCLMVCGAMRFLLAEKNGFRGLIWFGPLLLQKDCGRAVPLPKVKKMKTTTNRQLDSFAK